jgi:hypothetical protein
MQKKLCSVFLAFLTGCTIHPEPDHISDVVRDVDEDSIVVSYKGRHLEIPIGQLVNRLTQGNKVSEESGNELDQEDFGGSGDFPVEEKTSDVCLFSAATYAHWQAGEIIGQHPGNYVNMRHNPHVESFIVAKGRVGQQISVIGQYRHTTCDLWYKIWLPETKEQGWVHGDYVTISHQVTKPNLSSLAQLVSE